MAFVYMSNQKNITKAYKTKNLKSSYRHNINNLLSEQKKLFTKGQCLHYEAGNRCNEIIKAHSIQKNGLLSQIAVNGNVYYPSLNYSVLKNNKNIFQKAGINKVSSFKGFCGKHDNELFEPIDNFPLKPTDEQVFLYAYRTLCRELFVKENVLISNKQQLENVKNHSGYSNFYSGLVMGHENGLRSLRVHKSKYDTSLKEKSFQDIKYVIFYTQNKPMVAFAGVLYPDYDFLGNELQNLGDTENIFDLLTFCSVPSGDGWAFVFAWHKSSAKLNLKLMGSLAKVGHEGHRIDNYLFRFIILCCENTTFSSTWWESLKEEKKEEISERVVNMAEPLSVLSSSYLKEGLNHIVKWEFDKVYSKME